MRSASRAATFKHNPGTETRDEGKGGRPSIINHVGHYLSLSRSLARTNTLNFKHIPFLSLSPSIFIRQVNLFFVVSVIVSLSFPHTAAGQRETISNQDGSCTSRWWDPLFWSVCVCVRACVFRFRWQSILEFLGKSLPFIWRGERLRLFN